MRQVDASVSDVRAEIKRKPFGDTEISSVEDCLENILIAVEDLEEKIEGLKEEVDELQTELEDSNGIEINAIDGVSLIDTISGQVQYASDNLLDEGILDMFADLLCQVRPEKLQLYLEEIISKEGVRSS